MKLLICFISFKDDRLCVLLETAMAAFWSLTAIGSAPVTREESLSVQDLPSIIILQERDRTDRGKQKHLTQLWYLPGSIWQSPPCVSQGLVYTFALMLSTPELPYISDELFMFQHKVSFHRFLTLLANVASVKGAGLCFFLWEILFALLPKSQLDD